MNAPNNEIIGVVSTTPTLTLPPIDPAEVRLELIRNDIVIEIGRVTMLLSIAEAYVSLDLDDRLETAMNDARDRMRVALGYTSKLMRARRDAELNREAAVEWRRDQDSRRRA